MPRGGGTNGIRGGRVARGRSRGEVAMRAFLLAMAPDAGAQSTSASSPAGAAHRVTGEAVPLTVWGYPIAEFRAPVRQVSPAERAKRAAERIAAIPADVQPDEVRAEAATV